ncbi:MAG: amidase [Gammaproteobacteria bacterium]|nr:amidase [Gammaproteobacteria bacterium]MCP5198483.1 amidase [Gammaproteobacteria bacterium]
MSPAGPEAYTVTGLARRVAAGELTAGAVLEAQLAEVDRREPALGAIITDMRERARAQAAALDARIARGERVGPLAGVPIAIKDILDVSGLPTTAGMGIHRERIARTDATVVEHLEAAGAILTAKLALTEGVYAEHRPPFPAPRNPWSAAHWSGASSSGSGVATVGGLCVAAIGSETGGSIKLPAAANGASAIKPSWGRVSRHGVFELAATLDHVGTFARSVADAAAVLGVIAGPDPRDPTAAQRPVPDFAAAVARGCEGLVLGIDTAWIAAGADRETATALDAAVAELAAAGATVREVRVPDVTDMIWDWFGVCAVQTALAHRDTFPARRDAYGPALTQLLELGNRMSGCEYQQLLLRREDFRGRLNALFTTVDALALPVLGFPVPTCARMAEVDDDMIAGFHRFTCPFNLSGHPGVIMPNGSNAEGLPIVFQLVGRHFEEDRLVAAGAAYQQRTDWHLRRPVL